MGLSIYYCGRLRNPIDIPMLVDEVIDLCRSLHWNHQYITPNTDVPIEGVIVYIEGGDPVVLTFLPGGSLCHPFFFTYLRRMHDLASIEASQQCIVTHTQDAGPEVHMELIRILHYLHEKYFEEFTLNDDSTYWESNDADKCRECFAKSANDNTLFPSGSIQFPVDFRSSVVRLKKKLRRKF